MKARQAKKILRHLSVLGLKPGDVLVVRVPDALVTSGVLEQWQAAIDSCFPVGTKTLVIPRGVEIAAVRPVEAA